MANRVADSFFEVIDPAKTKVVAFPERVVVFGGATTRAGSRSQRPKSQRDVFLKWLRLNHPELNDVLLIPENYDDWNDFDTYSDLLLFEKDLGVLTNAVLVFVESPGAIAELGAFSQIPALSQRLVIVVGEHRHPRKSFISLGPIRSVEKTQEHHSSVCVLPDVNLTELATHMPVVMETLAAKRVPQAATASFDPQDPQHQILLVLDLIALFISTTRKEILALLKAFGIPMGMKRLNQILFALTKTKFVIGRQYGSVEYFVADKSTTPYLDFTAKTGEAPFNRERIRAARWEEVQADYNRKAAYGLVSKGQK